MKNKEIFTVEGSIPLKKALVEELGYTAYSEQTLNSDSCPYIKPSKYKNEVMNESEEADIHYVLPQDYDKAKQAFIDYFKEEELVVGKWYKSTKDKFMFVFESQVGDIVNYSYGFTVDGDWRGKDYFSKSYLSEMVPATEEEVKQALIAEAKKKGYVSNTIVHTGTNPWSLGEFEKFEYDIREDILKFYGKSQKNMKSGYTTSGWTSVYKDGKWAEILPSIPEYVKTTKNGGNCTQDSKHKKSYIQVGNVYKVLEARKDDSGGDYDIYVCEDGYVLHKEHVIESTKEEYEKQSKAPVIEVNGYKAVFYKEGVKFGCAEFSLMVFKKILELNHTMKSDTNTNRELDNIKLGKGTFTIKQIQEIVDYYKTNPKLEDELPF